VPVILDKILRAGEGKILKQLTLVADQTNRLEEDFAALSDAELRAMTDEFRSRLDDGAALADIEPEAYAVVREAARRVLGMRHFDVQIMGGAALHRGYVAEMRTGEGKTLVSTLPAYLNALTGDGVHIVTVNDYLAQRDADWMGRVHRFLGLQVGVILSHQQPAHRRAAYAADITYGTNNEFGFDYLRDNMAMTKDDLVQRGHHYAIVDEVDSILIDEARTPLIISGPADQPTKWYRAFADIVDTLERDLHYEVDEKKRTVGISEAGISAVEDQLGIENLYEAANTPLIQFLNNAIKAKELYRRDKDYVVIDGEVLIVDEHTGRILAGRRYNEGMHQAIEAKEEVEIKQENQTLATITLQNFFRLYRKLSGMTGTAMTESSEFNKIYDLGVVPIPTNKQMIRQDRPDLVYRTQEAKFDAVVEDIVARHEAGQPVLVGTASVETSELLSSQLRKRGVVHEVLNAKYHEREAAIIAQAGRKGAVTVATNMAGRGTDILLGGNPEYLAAQEIRGRGIDEHADPDAWAQAVREVSQRFTAQVAAEHAEVIDAGGLYVLGTERHESRRIDNQLRGRAGRQGDPGASRFYVSLQDDLMRRFGGALGMMERAMSYAGDDSIPIESKSITKSIQRAQAQAESQYFEIRKDVLKYDDVLNRQRHVIYDERRRVLEGEDLHVQIRGMLDDVVTAYVRGATGEGYPESWDLDQLWTALRQLYPVGVEVDEVVAAAGGRDGLSADLLTSTLVADAQRAYDAREAALGEAVPGEPVMRELERRVLLSVLDRRWREHLYEMDYLREGIGLRAMAQRNPLVEYQREGYDMFVTMLESIKEDTVGLLFNLEVQVAAPTADNQPALVAKGLHRASAPSELEYIAPTLDDETGVEHRAVRTDGEVAASPEPVAAGSGRTRQKRKRRR
jgi:preprotein translocase subunit SecA